MGLSYQRNPSEPMQPTQALKAPNLVTAFTQILHHQLLRYIAAIRVRRFSPKATPFLPRWHWRRQQDHIPIGFFKTCKVTKLRWDGVVSPFDDHVIDFLLPSPGDSVLNAIMLLPFLSEKPTHGHVLFSTLNHFCPPCCNNAKIFPIAMLRVQALSQRLLLSFWLPCVLCYPLL